jgi:hypothetical protein
MIRHLVRQKGSHQIGNLFRFSLVAATRKLSPLSQKGSHRNW